MRFLPSVEILAGTIQRIQLQVPKSQLRVPMLLWIGRMKGQYFSGTVHRSLVVPEGRYMSPSSIWLGLFQSSYPYLCNLAQRVEPMKPKCLKFKLWIRQVLGFIRLERSSQWINVLSDEKLHGQHPVCQLEYMEIPSQG